MLEPDVMDFNTKRIILSSDEDEMGPGEWRIDVVVAVSNFWNLYSVIPQSTYYNSLKILEKSK